MGERDCLSDPGQGFQEGHWSWPLPYLSTYRCLPKKGEEKQKPPTFKMTHSRSPGSSLKQAPASFLGGCYFPFWGPAVGRGGGRPLLLFEPRAAPGQGQGRPQLLAPWTEFISHVPRQGGAALGQFKGDFHQAVSVVESTALSPPPILKQESQTKQQVRGTL